MLNKFFIITNDNKKSLSLKKKLLKILDRRWLFSENEYEYIFVIGGDGTFLRSFDKYYDKKVILINGGNLGYFSFFNFSNINQINEKVLNEKNYINPLVIKTKINDYVYTSLNEVLIRSDTSMIVDIKIDNIKYETFRGSGLLISTPLGSTAHSKSANGAVIVPTENLIQLVEIEPIAQKKYLSLKSPLILNANSTIKIKCPKKEMCSKKIIIIDGKLQDQNFTSEEIFIYSEKSDFLLFNISDKRVYFSKLRNSFIRG